MLEIKQLTKKDIPQVLQLSDRIFAPILQGLNKNEDKNIWWENYKKNGLLLGAYMDESLVGFIFFYEKEKGIRSMHCWMDGVDKKFRGSGILKALMERGQKVLKEKGYKFLSEIVTGYKIRHKLCCIIPQLLMIL